ncbi:MAG: hypothetical protein ACJAWL_000852 [Motiliproteus sp.]|jgi:hypothetical protein
MRTRNSTKELNNFDMIWSVTQDSVNAQLKYLFNFGDINTQISVGDLNEDGFNLNTTLLAPALIFDSAMEGHASMVISLDTGTLTTWTGFGANAKTVEHDCKGWKIGFDVRLSLIGLKDLKAPSKAVHEKMKHSGFMDTQRFSVRGLFLDFQNTNFSSFDDGRTTVILSDASDANAAESARVKTMFYNGLRTHFEAIKTSENPYALGYTVENVTPPAGQNSTPALFAPTGVAYSTHRYQDPGQHDSKAYLGRSTLNFMMMTDQIPPSTDPRDGHFDRNLVEESGIDGTALIRQELFVQQYLKQVWDKIVDALDPGTALVHLRSGGVPNVRNETLSNGFSLSESITSSDDLGNYVRPFYTQTKKLTMRLVNASDHIEFRGTGTLFSELLVKQYAWPNTYMGQFWGKSSTSLDFCIKFLAGTDGKIQIIPEFKITPQPLDRGHSGAFGSLSSVLDDLGVGPNIQAMLGSVTEQTQMMVKSEFIDQIRGSFAALAGSVILPGANDFFYKKLQLSPEGNVQLYMTYKLEDE